MQGRKTHEQFKHILEHKPGVDAPPEPASPKRPDPGSRQSEFSVSRQGMHQESEHNKHNNPPQGAPKH